jgi:hypothetical protein
MHGVYGKHISNFKITMIKRHSLLSIKEIVAKVHVAAVTARKYKYASCEKCRHCLRELYSEARVCGIGSYRFGSVCNLYSERVRRHDAKQDS